MYSRRHDAKAQQQILGATPEGQKQEEYLAVGSVLPHPPIRLVAHSRRRLKHVVVVHHSIILSIHPHHIPQGTFGLNLHLDKLALGKQLRGRGILGLIQVRLAQESFQSTIELGCLGAEMSTEARQRGRALVLENVVLALAVPIRRQHVPLAQERGRLGARVHVCLQNSHCHSDRERDSEREKETRERERDDRDRERGERERRERERDKRERDKRERERERETREKEITCMSGQQSA